MLCALSLAVMTWTGGFDILYALQDAEFDKRNGLHSLPSSIGVRKAINVARALHVITVLCLATVIASDPLRLAAQPDVGIAQSLLWVGVTIAAALLVWEHRLVKPDDLSRLDAAFFTMNGIISMFFFVCVLAATVLARGSLSTTVATRSALAVVFA